MTQNAQEQTEGVALLPCPFCGGAAIYVPEKRGGGGRGGGPKRVIGFRACCDDALCAGWMGITRPTREEARAAWNRRSPSVVSEAPPCTDRHCPDSELVHFHALPLGEIATSAAASAAPEDEGARAGITIADISRAVRAWNACEIDSDLVRMKRALLADREARRAAPTPPEGR